MHVTFLLGPAGSGKTWRCLAEIRDALRAAPEGPPLLLLAPKQATFQLERQLLASPELPGYTRLQIVSFERLARFILSELTRLPPLLDEEGRVMVLRALLAQMEREGRLRVFHATARLPGFARQLSRLLRELQQHQVSSERLARLAARPDLTPTLAAKLHDWGALRGGYLKWLRAHGLEDAHRLLDLATEALRALGPAGGTPGAEPAAAQAPNRSSAPAAVFRLGGLWLDGFAEMTPQELDLLAALVPHAQRATLAFCLDGEPADNVPWLSTWSVVAQTFRQCRQRLCALPGCVMRVEVLPRDPARNRFAPGSALAHLEKTWTSPVPDDSIPDLPAALRAALCPNPEAEAVLAAHEILRHVRAGGRFRDCAVLVRSWDDYHEPLRRVFARREIPFFLDRREPVAHHPLAELTRSALRTLAFGWRHEDWFGALKSGLVPVAEEEIDWLENAALEHGWEGEVWSRPIALPEQPALERLAERLRRKLVPPFLHLAGRLAASGFQPNGAQLAEALRELWAALDIERQLAAWAGPAGGTGHPPAHGPPAALHATVWEQMNLWLDNLARAFPAEAAPLREWLPILEAGLSGLTVGVIPPALDQVLIGAIDRSRHPDLELALVLGLNEGVFPAPPSFGPLLTEADREELETHQVHLGPGHKLRLGHERYFGYIACTRARRRLVLTGAQFDARDRKLNRSLFFDHLQRLFPALVIEEWSPPSDWTAAEHVHEVLAPLLRLVRPAARPAAAPSRLEAAAISAPRCEPAAPAGASAARLLDELAALPAVASALETLAGRRWSDPDERLSPELAARLYGPELQTSVSRLEQFAECPFRFFVHSGLRAQERLRFEADPRRLGHFQHEVLRRFHEELRAQGRGWHGISPIEARVRVRNLAEDLAPHFGGGVLRRTARDRFLTRQLIGALEEFIDVIVGWMPQYNFEPVAVELGFGGDGPLPAWRLPLANGRSLTFTGVMDRVDLWWDEDGAARAVVVDYKSSARRIDPCLLENGVQLQLPAYASALRRLPEAKEFFGVTDLVPAGVFYVDLRGRYEAGPHRDEALADAEAARRRAYRHSGRFDAALLDQFDNRPVPPGQPKAGDQFNFRLTAAGKLHGACREPMPSRLFLALLDTVEARLREMGERILAGDTRVDPYRHRNQVPCQRCDYRAVCRIDPWTHPYRALRPPPKATEADPP